LTFRLERLTVFSSKLVSKNSAMRYTVVIEQGPTSFGAYVPDLPGCIAAAESRVEVVSLIREAIEFHLEGLREDGVKVPEPHSSFESVEVAAA
jgi:predicted RNase H-like HicB family nuclease